MHERLAYIVEVLRPRTPAERRYLVRILTLIFLGLTAAVFALVSTYVITFLLICGLSFSVVVIEIGCYAKDQIDSQYSERSPDIRLQRDDEEGQNE